MENKILGKNSKLPAISYLFFIPGWNTEKKVINFFAALKEEEEEEATAYCWSEHKDGIGVFSQQWLRIIWSHSSWFTTEEEIIFRNFVRRDYMEMLLFFVL